MQVHDCKIVEMKRDMDLVRELLIQIESNPVLDGSKWMTPSSPEEIGIQDRSIEEVAYHLDLLVEAHLVRGFPGQRMATISKLTWQGHEFLDDIRDHDIWSKTKERIKGLPTIAIGIVAEIAKAEIKKKLGLS
jgi:hypothetical protein